MEYSKEANHQHARSLRGGLLGVLRETQEFASQIDDHADIEACVHKLINDLALAIGFGKLLLTELKEAQDRALRLQITINAVHCAATSGLNQDTQSDLEDALRNIRSAVSYLVAPMGVI